MALQRSKARRPRGGVMIYMIVLMPVIVGMAVLGVDVGRLALTRTELQTIADAAARYAAAGMASSTSKQATAYSQASAVCGESRADGRQVAVAASDVAIGNWNTATRVFSVTTDGTGNAVQVTLRAQLGAGDSPRLFVQSIGGSSRGVVVHSVALATVVETEVNTPSQGNLWLAGMPDNTSSTNLQGIPEKYDSNGTSADRLQRPLEVSLASLGLAPGDWVSFEGLSGVGSNGGGSGNTGPDGQTNFIVSLGSTSPPLPTNSLNGIANARAPLAGVMAVFMDAASPASSPAPTGLDFATEAQRDYTQLTPSSKQPFFVGDGKTSEGEVQRIKIPVGATRIFLGMMDAWQWNDNTGTFRMKFYRGTTVSTVK